MTVRLPPIDALLHVLREERVTTVFGNPGTTELPLLDALATAPDLRYVLGTHEGSVMSMADGYARATRRPAFVNLHVAAGLANGMVGLLNARRSHTPLVVTAGQQDRRHLAQDPMLAGDLVAMARPVVKEVFDVQHGFDLPLMLRRAFAAAVRPPAGPVFLSLPMDLLAEDEPVVVSARSATPELGVSPAVRQAAELLARADRPAIVAGDGVGRGDAVAELVTLAEACGATVHHQPMFDGIDFPLAHPLYGGMLPATNAGIRAVLQDHDVVLVVGTHAFRPHHYTAAEAIPPSVTIIQLEDCSETVGWTVPADVAMVGDVRATVEALAAALAGRVPAAHDRIDRAARQADQRRRVIESGAAAGHGLRPMPALAAMHALAAGLPADAVVVEEAITSGLRLRDVLRLDRPGSYLHTVGGGLGFGIGAAIGHRMGAPDRPVVAVLGDGCAMFGLQGLWTAARHQVPVVFAVMNNGEYRTLKETPSGRDGVVHQGRPGLDLGPPALDFTVAARFFGVDAVRVLDPEELTSVIAKGAAGDAPLLVDVAIAGHRDA